MAGEVGQAIGNGEETDRMVDEREMGDITYGLAASPSFGRDGICYAARGSGLYRSQDGGITWELAYGNLDLQAPLTTMAVAVTPDDTDDAVFAGVAGGVLTSYDQGRTWQVAHVPEPAPVVAALAVSPDYRRDGVVLAATLEDGVLSSADRGRRWVRWNFGLLDLTVYCLAMSPRFAQDETVYAGTETGIFRSTNGGRAWRETDFPLELAPVLSLAIAPGRGEPGTDQSAEGGPLAAGPDTLLAGTEEHGLWYSSDGGRTWDRLGAEVQNETVNAVLVPPTFPVQPDLLMLLSDAILVSRDGGASWSDWQAGLVFDSSLTCTAAPEGLEPGATLLVGLAAGGVLRV